MASSELFNRQARVTITSASTPLYDTDYSIEESDTGGVVIEGMRIAFDIEHNLTKNPNHCTIKLTNLSKETRSALKKSPLKLTLEAGYRGNLALIFKGDITYASSTLEGADWVTEIECADGGRVLRHARVSKSYAPGTPKINILMDILGSSKLKLPAYASLIPGLQIQVDSGLTILDTLQNAVISVLKPAGVTFTIQDGEAVLLREDDAHGQPYEVGVAQAMIGSPEFGKPDKKGRPPNVTIKTLLYPQIRPGRPVKVTSRELNGTFKVTKVKHSGDTHGAEWTTEIEIKAPGSDPSSKQGGSSGFGGGQFSGGGATSSF